MVRLGSGSPLAWSTFAIYENGRATDGVTRTKVPASPNVVRISDTLAPPRKTQKMLGDRTIVMDRWGQRGWNQLNPPNETAATGGAYYPGDGFYGHKDGYNILYGDASCRWYSDLNQKWIWIPYLHHAFRGDWQYGLMNMSLYDYGTTNNPLGTDALSNDWRRVSAQIQAWLYFDMDAGVSTNCNPSWSPW